MFCLDQIHFLPIYIMEAGSPSFTLATGGSEFMQPKFSFHTLEGMPRNSHLALEAAVFTATVCFFLQENVAIGSFKNPNTNLFLEISILF